MFMATLDTHYVACEYHLPAAIDDCTLTVYAHVEAGSPSQSLLTGKTINVVLSNGTARAAQIDASGYAVFSNLPRNITGTLTYGNALGIAFHTNPATQSFSTANQSVSLEAIWKMKNPGLFLVMADGTEVDFFTAQQHPEYTYVLIHVATQTLIDNNGDFYFRPIDAGSVIISSKQFASETVLLPNVPTYTSLTSATALTDYNGADNTNKMISDCATLKITSSAADTAVQSTLTFGGNTYNGWIGTAKQWEQFAANILEIKSLITQAGYSFNVIIAWTSTQYNANTSWIYVAYSNNIGTANNKKLGYQVVPFFSI